MEPQGERPVWSMSGSEKLAALDALEADIARRQTYRLHLIASLDHDGYAQEIGAHDTTQLLAFRYRLDRPQARRDVRLAQTLAKYPAVSAALPATDDRTAAAAAEPADDPHAEPAGDSQAGRRPGAADSAGSAAGFLRPAQAEAIVSALERVPDTVPVEDLDVAERELVGLARHLSPAELRKAGQRVRDLLDTDGPEPDEHHAYDRESLTLTTADRGVTFRGYLANENAELLRSLIHAGARPHRTITGDLDPRPRDKRQADALTTALTIAATAYDTGTADRVGAGTSSAGAPAPLRRMRVRRKRVRLAPDTASPDTTDAGTAGAGTTGAGTGMRVRLAPTPLVPIQRVAGTADADAMGEGAAGAGRAGAGTADGRCDRCPRAGRVPGFGAKANITVTIDLQDLKSATADAIGDLVYGDGLSAATIRRLACDARIIPLVLGSKSEPLDVGRAERLVTGAMRRALNARDKGCVVCGAPPVQCEAHHLQSWIDGGDTAIHNLGLLCRRHHLDLHAGEWTITITNGEVHLARPTWADPPPQHPNQPARPPDPGRPRHQPAQLPPRIESGPSRAASAAEPGSAIPSPDLGSAATQARSAADGQISSSPTTSGIRGGMLHRMLLADSEGAADLAPSSLREAVSLAIWGEVPTPRQADPDGSALSGDRPGDRRDERSFDPWREGAGVVPYGGR